MKKSLYCLMLIVVLIATVFTGIVMAKDYTIAGIFMVAEHEWFKTVEIGMRKAAEKYGVNLVVGNAALKIDKEASLVDTYVAQQVDAIAISPLNVKASVPALKRAVNQGIELVVYNTKIDSEIMDCFVGVDNYELGAQNGRYLIEWLDKKGIKDKVDIALITIPQYIQGQKRRNGFVEAIKDDPRINIVAEQAGEVAEQAANVAESILQAHPEIDIIWASNEGGTVGAMIGVRNSGKTGKVKVFGTDMSVQLSRALLSDEKIVEAISTQNPYMIGYKSIEAAVKKLKGEKVPEKIIVPLEMYTRENLDAVKEYLEKYEKLTS